MAKTTELGIRETKGQFQVVGIVSNCNSNDFFTETTTQSNRPKKTVQFDVRFDKEKTMRIKVTGTKLDQSYFLKKTKGDNGQSKYETKPVDWAKTYSFAEENPDWRLIGVNCGLSKTTIKEGNKVKEVNDKKLLTNFDACDEVHEKLKDGMNVFVKGNIKSWSFTNENGDERRGQNFEANQISLCKPIDFEDEEFKPQAFFQQEIVFMGIKPNEDKSKYIVTAKIVTYNSIEDAEFIIENPKLAQLFKKELKPYTGILVSGFINVEKEVETVTETDLWGEANPMQKINSPTKRELVIISADPKTIEKEIWSEENIDAAIAKMKKNEDVKSDWGENADLSAGDDDDDINDLWNS